MLCLLCNGTDKSYKPEPDKDFICGSCVQLLLRADQDDLKQAYAKAIEKEYPDKAEAIKSFIIEDEFNVRKAKNSKQNMERARPLRSVRPSRDKVWA